MAVRLMDKTLSATNVVEALRTRLLARHSILALDRVNEPRISAAVAWIRSKAAVDGYWGYASPTATCICTLGLALWREPEEEALLERCCQWLLQISNDGKWETWWDTAVALRAIELADLGNMPMAVRGKERVLALEPDRIVLKPHHAAQILNLITVLRDEEHQRAWIQKCLALLHVSRDEYEKGQLVHALLSAGVFEGSVRKALHDLAGYAVAGQPTASSFLSYVVCLQALATASDEHARVVGTALDHVFTDAYRKDGSWYHDAWYTGWAICALREIKAVRRLVIDLPTFGQEFEAARAEIAKSSAIDVSRRRTAALGSVSVVLLLGFVIAIVSHWDPQNPLLSSGVLVAVVVPLIGVALRIVWPLLR